MAMATVRAVRRQKPACPASAKGDKDMIGGSMLPGWDTFVLAVPILGVFAMMIFGLDERCASPKRGRGSRRMFCQVGVGGPTDPDGRPWKKAAIRRVEAQLIP